MKLNHKVMILTGAGAGIGRALTLQLLNRGATVVALDQNAEALAETFRQSASSAERLHTYVVNVADKEAVNQVIATITADMGEFDGLINNAGIIQPFVKVQSLEQAQIERVMDVNFYGPLYLLQATLPKLLMRPEAHILNVSSMGGFFPFPGQVIYGASKAALKILTEGLYAELLGTSVGVTVCFPGAILTEISANSGVQTPVVDANGSNHRGLSPEQAAGQILDAIERNRPRVFVGKDSRMMDWFYRLAPIKATHFMQRQMQRMITIE